MNRLVHLFHSLFIFIHFYLLAFKILSLQIWASFFQAYSNPDPDPDSDPSHNHQPPHDEDNLKTILITGADSGIGKALAQRLVKQKGYRVIGLVHSQAQRRNEVMGASPREADQDKNANVHYQNQNQNSTSASALSIIPVPCDLRSLKQIKNAVHAIQNLLNANQLHDSSHTALGIDVLIHSAGVMFVDSGIPQKDWRNKNMASANQTQKIHLQTMFDLIEHHVQVNTLAPLLLTQALCGRHLLAPNASVIYLSSEAHRAFHLNESHCHHLFTPSFHQRSKYQRYALSKLAGALCLDYYLRNLTTLSPPPPSLSSSSVGSTYSPDTFYAPPCQLSWVSIHPGVVLTGLYQYERPKWLRNGVLALGKRLFWTPEMAAERIHTRLLSEERGIPRWNKLLSKEQRGVNNKNTKEKSNDNNMTQPQEWLSHYIDMTRPNQPVRLKVDGDQLQIQAQLWKCIEPWLVQFQDICSS